MQLCTFNYYMSGYISSEVILFLHWLHFITIGLYYRLLDFKMYSIVESAGFPLMINAVSCNLYKRENTFTVST